MAGKRKKPVTMNDRVENLESVIIELVLRIEQLEQQINQPKEVRAIGYTQLQNLQNPVQNETDGY